MATNHRAKPRRRSALARVLSGFGELLITVGVVVALFLVWQLWWTGFDANKKAAAHTVAFHETQVDSPKTEGHPHTEDPPVPDEAAYGETIGMLIVPKWYGVTNNNMPIVEAAAGHYPDTQQVGEIGNFALAGHRRTNGNSFLRIDTLEEGDEIVVATKDTWYVYTVSSHEIVDPTQVDVIAPVPGDQEAQPVDRYITLTTCHSLTTGEWGNDHRWIVHGKFSYWMPRTEGRPASVLNDPEVN